MSAIDNMIQIAGTQKGISTGKKYWNYVMGSGYSNGSSTPWCACFASWCLNQAGLKAPGLSAKGTAAAGTFASKASAKGKLTKDMSKCGKGDLLIYNYNGSGWAQHVGICTNCVKSGSNYKLSSIEGNTGNGVVGTYSGVVVSAKGKMISGRTFSTVHVVKISDSNATVDNINDDDDSSSGSSSKFLDWLSDIFGSFTDKYSTIAYTIGNTQPKYVYETTYKTVTTTVTRDRLLTVDYDTAKNQTRTKSTNLLSTPTYVQSPFVMVKMGNYTFGTYSSSGALTNHNSSNVVMYPNYIDSIDIVKVNGSVNQYTIGMSYQIERGQDPNLLDKIFASVGYGTIEISYGDWNAPTFIYKSEEALITKVTSKVDFSRSRISYTVNCTSACVAVTAQYQNFASVKAKPSDVIKKLLYGSGADEYGLLSTFPGMSNSTFGKSCIMADDKKVKIPAKMGIDPLSYINFLVSCMISTSNSDSDAIQDSSYYMVIKDDTYNEHGGTYFVVNKMKADENTTTINQSDVYEVDVGYPTDNLITDFTINDDNSWSLLYEFSENTLAQNYSYSITNDGTITEEYAPNVMMTKDYITPNANVLNWWTQMTKFPITATITMKGLVRPAMLMTYLRVNALFYGQRHVSSGLYIITKEEDKIDHSGYSTTLTLTRIGGDEDYIGSVEVTTTKTIAVQNKVENKNYVGGTQIESKTYENTTNNQVDNIKAADITTESVERIMVAVNGYGTDTYRHGKLSATNVKKSDLPSKVQKWYKKGSFPYWNAKDRLNTKKVTPSYQEGDYTLTSVQLSNTYMKITGSAVNSAGIKSGNLIYWRPKGNPSTICCTYKAYFDEDTLPSDSWAKSQEGNDCQRYWIGYDGKKPSSLGTLITNNPDNVWDSKTNPYADYTKKRK